MSEIATLTSKNNVKSTSNEKLKVLACNTLHVNAFDLSDFISTIYSVPYSFLVCEQANNECSYEFLVDGILSEEDQEILQDFISGKNVLYSANAVLNDLASRELISTGHYVIQVIWG